MTKAMRTSLLYSGLIVAMMVTINLLTSPGFLWFVFPVFGVLWWPLSVYFSGRKNPLAYSLCGTGLLFAFFLLTYFIVSPHAHPWILYPLLAVVWWPLSVWGAQAGARKFSVAGGAYTILMLLTMNLVASPGFGWWVYPAFLTLWWPLSVLMGERAKTFTFALGSALAGIAFTVIMYLIHSPGGTPWYLFTLLPLLWWPVTLLLAPRVGELRQTLIGIVVFAAYYTGLTALLYSMNSLLPLFSLIGAIWVIYALGISKHRDQTGFAAINAILLAAYCILAHRVLTPGVHPWYWYTFFPLAWWVFALALRDKAFAPRNIAISAAALLLYYGALNLLLSPAVPWVLFLTWPTVSAILGAWLHKTRAAFPFSVWMTLAGAAYFTAINLAFTPHTVWAVYPIFGLLWWPLSMWLHTRRLQDDEKAPQANTKA